MNEKYLTGEKSRSLESLRHLRLMALLRELIRDEGRMEAAEMLGVNYKTLAKTVDTGILSRRMSHALERLLLSGGGSAVAKQQERIQALEARSDALEKEVRSAHAAGEVEVKALREEHAVTIEEVRQRLTQVDARQREAATAHAPTTTAASAEKQPVTTGVTRRRYPELVTVEPALDDEAVFGAAWPLIDEWRTLRASHPIGGKSLSWLVTHERILEMELAMAEKHGLTLPPEPMPLTGHWRRRQLSWRWTALYDTQRARVKRELLRWVRRILTVGLWRK